MTTAEIMALVEEMQRDDTPHNAVAVARLCIAIETMLARQAEVLEEIMFDYSLHSENVRAILNPENET